MGAFFSTIGVAVALFLIFLFIVFISSIGIKSVLFPMFEFIESLCNKFKFQKHKDIFKSDDVKDGAMKTISITSGTCSCCGKKYIGTTDDENTPLKEVSIFGETKVLCYNCLDKLVKQWEKKNKTNEVIFTQSAENLKNIFNNKEENK